MGSRQLGSTVGFVGRERELDVLREIVADAVRGRCGVALIEGEPGIGKSRLITEALSAAHGGGIRVLAGWCDEVEHDRPLRALSEALAAVRASRYPGRAELTRLLGDHGLAAGAAGVVAGSPDAGWLIVEAVLEELEQLTWTGPVALVIEDLQWADPLTLRAVHAIARYLNRSPLAVLITVRQGSRPIEVEQVVTELLTSGAEHVVLGPLSTEAATALASQVAGVTAGEMLLEQVAGAAGNPLFVIELVQSLDEDGALDRSSGRAEARPSGPPPTVRLTILRRLSREPEEVVHLLRLASILGSSFSIAELATVAGRKVAEILPALTTAAGVAGLLTESDGRLAFRHELVRDAIYHDLPLPVRKALHREVAATLTATDAPVERAATHFALGADPGDVEATSCLRRAAHVTAPRAPATAIGLLERAREITDPRDPLQAELDAELIEPLRLTGRLSEAEQTSRRLLDARPRPDVEVLARVGLASVLATRGRYPPAIEQFELARVVAPIAQQPSMAAAAAVLMVLAGDIDRARDAADGAVSVGERDRDDSAVGLGLQALAMAELATGQVDDAAALAQRAVAVADRGNAVWGTPRLWHGTALADADRFAEADTVLQAGRDHAEQTGNLTHLPLFHWAIAELRLAAGQWDDAAAEADAGLSLIRDSGPESGEIFAHAINAHVAFHRGNLAVARAVVQTARATGVAGPVEIGYEWIGWIAALLEESDQDPQVALSTLAAAWHSIAPIRYLQAATRAMAPDLVRMAIAGGDRPLADTVTREIERGAALSGSPTARGIAARCRGLLDNDLDALVDAVDAHRQGPRPYPVAAACEDAAVALARTGRLTDARSLLHEAIDIYHRLDAVRDLDRIRPVMRRVGIQPPRRQPSRARFGWQSLTPTERTVVELTVTGLTNRQIAERLYVSRRTVATHLEHVYQKLGINNRVELTAQAVHRTATETTTRTGRPAPAAAPASPRTPAAGHPPH